MRILRNSPEEHIIDINELVFSITREQTYPLQDEIKPKNKTESALIHVVKRHALDKYKEMYKPKFLSVRPYHYGSPTVQDMQKVKYAYLDYILKLNPERTFADYLGAIKEIENDVKYMYADEIKMNRDTFLKTLLLDGCFILVALNALEMIQLPNQDSKLLDANIGEINVGTKLTEVGDQRNDITQGSIEKLGEEENSNWKYYHREIVLHDILLLENQIPFYVVKKIFEVLSGSIHTTSLLTNSIMEFMVNKISCIPSKIREDLRHREFHHLLHLCHMFFTPNQLFKLSLNESELYQLHTKSELILPHVLESQSIMGSKQLHWRQATQYRAAKIDFKKRELCSDNVHSLLEIRFCNGTLEIPCLSVDPTTYCLLSNLVAFEQACPQFGNYITSYIQFWSQLVSTPNDVAMPIEKGIIINHLQSDMEVTKLFSALCEDVVFDFNGENYLKPLCHMVEAHYQHQRSRRREIFGVVSSIIQSWVSRNQPDCL